jgi:hypothetical protein
VGVRKLRGGRHAGPVVAEELTAAAFNILGEPPAVLLAATFGAEALAALQSVHRPGGSPVVAGARLALAAERLLALDEDDRAGLSEVIGSAHPALGAYLTQTLAAGRGAVAVCRLVERVGLHRRDVGWLHHHLGVLTGIPGAATFTDDDGARLRLRQQSSAVAGATAVVLMRALLDPPYALWLTTGIHLDPDREPDGWAFEQRFRAQQNAVHSTISRQVVGPMAWPRFLGTPPTALSRFINRFAGLTGYRFGWVALDDVANERRQAALTVLRAALVAGVPVPVYLGRPADRHVVLALPGPVTDPPPEHLRVYDPAAGAVVDVAASSWAAGAAGMTGWERLEGVVLPRRREI